MKTFAELKQGDKIYYWDHGKMHEQTVHSVKKTQKVDEWKDYFGRTIKNTYEMFVIEAGKGGKIEFWFKPDNTIIRHRGMTRFSCLESAQAWLSKNATEYYARANKHKKKFDRAYACAIRYDKAHNDITVW